MRNDTDATDWRDWPEPESPTTAVVWPDCNGRPTVATHYHCVWLITGDTDGLTWRELTDLIGQTIADGETPRIIDLSHEPDTPAAPVDHVTVTWKSGEPTDELLRVARMEGARVTVERGGATVEGPICGEPCEGVITVGDWFDLSPRYGNCWTITVTAPKPTEPEWAQDECVIVTDRDGDSVVMWRCENGKWSSWRGADGTDTTERMVEHGTARRLSPETRAELVRLAGGGESMSLFRKKPVTIEARRLAGDTAETHSVSLWVERENKVTLEDSPEGRAFKAEYGLRGGLTVVIDPADGALIIPTLEGLMRATYGDWIIKGVSGEFSPCKPDIFEKTYEPAGGER